MRFEIILLFLLEVLSCFVNAQDPVMVNFTVEDGLPSDEIHDLVQSSDGKLWIATNRGISTFDGYYFRNYTSNDGLSDMVIFEIFKDYKNRLWFISQSGNLSFYHNQKINKFEFNGLIQKYMGKNTYPIVDFYCDSLDNIYLSQNNNGFIKIDKNGIIEHNQLKNISGIYKEQYVDRFKEGNLFYYTEYTEGKEISRYTKEIIKLHFIQEKKIELINLKRTNSFHFFSYQKINDEYYFHVNGSLYSWSEGGLVLLFSFDIPIKTFTLLNDEIWVGLRGGGLRHLVPSKGKYYVQNSLLENQIITKILVDNDKGIWVSTVRNGIYYLPSKSSITLSLPDSINKRFSSISVSDKILFAGNETGNILISRNEGSVEIVKSKNYTNSEIQKIFIDDSILYVITRNNVMVFKNIKNEYQEVLLDERLNYRFFNVKNIVRDSDGFIYFIGKSISRIHNHESQYLLNRDTGLMYFTDLCKIRKNQYWICSEKGLYLLKNGKLSKFDKNKDLLDARINHMSLIGDILILGTEGEGIMLYYTKTNEVIFVEINNERFYSSVSGIEFFNNYHAWIATSRGLVKIELNDIEAKNYNAYNFGVMDGLLSEELTDIAIQGEYLFLSSNEGISKHLIKEFSDSNHFITMNINEIKVNQKFFNPDTNFYLSHDMNSILFNYIGIDLKNNRGLEYNYRLVGKDTSWRFTGKLFVEYNDLDPGKYEFQIFCKNRNGNKTSSIKNVSFTISPPFWKTWWFMSIEAGFAISAVSFIFIRRAKIIDSNTKREIEINKKIANLEMRALRTQMNPHFLFNSLNSIYSMINAGQNEVAGKFLLRFSKLLRIIIEQSPQAKISLEDELRLLTIYVDLEKMRFNNKFDYVLNIEDSIDPKTLLVPSFILQPFAENAIIHGLMNKKNDDKRLVIEIKLKEGELHCIIRDNGVGRSQAEIEKAKKGNKNKSVAISNTKQRLEMINIDAKNPIVSVEVNDLRDDKSNVSGTEVYLRIEKEILDPKKSSNNPDAT